MSEQHPHRLTGNVRGDLVGHEGAEELEIEDNTTTALATLVLGGILVVVSIATLTQASSLDNKGNAVGPATAPWIVGALLLIVGVLLALRGRQEFAQAREEHTPDHQTSTQDWKRLAVLLVALIVFAAINPFLGYVVSATVLFGVTAIVLGAPNRLKSFAYGFIVASVVFLVFDVLIGITLPAAVWGF
jgi:putative tricarboxylic transport membrane protein